MSGRYQEIEQSSTGEDNDNHDDKDDDDDDDDNDDDDYEWDTSRDRSSSKQRQDKNKEKTNIKKRQKNREGQDPKRSPCHQKTCKLLPGKKSVLLFYLDLLELRSIGFTKDPWRVRCDMLRKVKKS